jgi:hypothetical protein
MQFNNVNSSLPSNFEFGAAGIGFGVVGCFLYHKMTHLAEYLCNKNGTKCEKIFHDNRNDSSLHGRIIASAGMSYIWQLYLKRILICAATTGITWTTAAYRNSSKTYRIAAIIPTILFTFVDMLQDTYGGTCLRDKRWVLLSNEEVKKRNINPETVPESLGDHPITYLNWYSRPVQFLGNGADSDIE